MNKSKLEEIMNMEQSKAQFKYLAIGVLMAFAITCVVFLAYALLITYTNMSERNLPIVVAVTTFLSVMVAGFDAAKGATQRGWMWGMGAGLIYVLILAILMIVLLPTFAVDGRTFTVVVLGLAGGGLGGMLGINLKK